MAYSHYRRKCSWCEDCIAAGEGLKAEATLSYDGNIIFKWSDNYIDNDCDNKCYKCGFKYCCDYSPLTHRKLSDYYGEEYDDQEMEPDFFQYMTEIGEDLWGCDSAEDIF